MRFIVYDQAEEPVLANGKITYKAKAVNTDYKYNFYKTFQITLSMVNQLFDLKGIFYDFAFTKAKIILSIKLNPYSISKLFFTE